MCEYVESYITKFHAYCEGKGFIDEKGQSVYPSTLHW